MMKILLADPHLEVRTALRLVLEQQPGEFVLGEVRDTIGLFAQLTRDCPDVILLDLNLPGVRMPKRTTRSTLEELVATLHSMCPTTRLIGLSSQPGVEKDCLQAGTDAFFCKSDPPDALLALLQRMLPAVHNCETDPPSSP